MVASSQPLASAAGVKILEKGGNCVDAAVAVSAVLCVTEPPSTGVGGDCFVLYYDNSNRKVHGLNGCGKSPKNISVDAVKKQDPSLTGPRLPLNNVHSITVPGAIAGWLDAIELWGSGKVSVADILGPAIDLALKGFAVSEISAHMWKGALRKLIRQSGENAKVFLNDDGSFVLPGQVFTNKPLARLLTKVAEEGKDGFYKGDVAEKIVAKVKEKGGFLEMEDLASHTSKLVDPICLEFMGKYLWEIPPNGQGIVALLALGYLRELLKQSKISLEALEHNSAEYLNLLIEAIKLAFHDSEHCVADPEFHPEIDVKHVLSEKYLADRAQLIQPGRILSREIVDAAPDPMYKSDTVYFTTSDKDGNACSFINSVFSPFGTGIIPDDYGFALQSRGGNFNLTPGAINVLEGGKRPYHTIIPSLITEKDHDDNDKLYASVACMGGWEQPQAHVQIFLNMVLFSFTPQEAIDAPRFCLEPNEELRHLDVGKGSFGPVSTPKTVVRLEEGISEETIRELQKMGHLVDRVSGYAREVFGRAQCIQNIGKDGQVVWAGGSDQRGDGAAIPQL